MKKFFLLFIIIFPSIVWSQTVLTGVVKNNQGEPVSANVMVQAKGSATISGSTATDAEGKYSLIYKGAADTLTIIVSGIMIGKHTQTIPNRSGQVNFSVEEKDLELKEVAVRATPIRRTGDTITYLVGAYANQNDRVIEDVLKKMPGIEVLSSGAISYNGKTINKFYVENLDLLQGRYGIAVKNIAAKDVASVQVLENHQPIKALKDKLISESAAINLKLKDSAKGALALTALTGGGYKPIMWNVELVAMYFTSKKQNISTYKGNNSGNEVASEFRSHYEYERISPDYGSFLSVATPSTPPVAQKRYLHNRSNSISSNQLFKINKDLEITANALYYNDRVEKEGYSFSEQFLSGDSSLRIEEQVKSLSKTDNLELAFRLNSNADDHFFNNALNFKGAWNNDRVTGISKSNAGNLDSNLSQFLDRPVFSVDNTLNLIKNVNKDSYKLYFSTAYGHRPHSLNITPVNYFGNDKLAQLEQNVLSKDFASTLRISYGRRIGNLYVDYNLSGNVDMRNLNTELTGTDSMGMITPPPDSLRNDLWYNSFQVILNQLYTYKVEGKFAVNLSLPTANYTLTTDNRIQNSFSRYNRWVVNPSLTAFYNLITELAVSAGANFRKTYGNMNDVYTGYIMHSYRSLLRNTIDRLFETRSGGANVSLQYRDAFRATFFNVSANYGKSWKNLLYGYDYQGIMSIKTTIDQPTESENYGLSFNGSKGFRFWRTTFRVSGGYNESRGEQLIQNKILHSRSQSYRAGVSVNASPARFINLNYNFNRMQSRSFVKEFSERFPFIRSNSSVIKVDLFPLKTVTVNLSTDYQYNSAANNHNTTFADAGIKYKHKKIEWELECNNLFNAKQYVSASYSDISTYYYSYDLRPVSVLLKVRFKLK
jgi:hypothetical protein